MTHIIFDYNDDIFIHQQDNSLDVFGGDSALIIKSPDIRDSLSLFVTSTYLHSYINVNVKTYGSEHIHFVERYNGRFYELSTVPESIPIMTLFVNGGVDTIMEKLVIDVSNGCVIDVNRNSAITDISLMNMSNFRNAIKLFQFHNKIEFL